MLRGAIVLSTWFEPDPLWFLRSTVRSAVQNLAKLLEKDHKIPKVVQVSFFERVGVEMHNVIADVLDDLQRLNEFGTVKL